MYLKDETIHRNSHNRVMVETVLVQSVNDICLRANH